MLTDSHRALADRFRRLADRMETDEIRPHFLFTLAEGVERLEVLVAKIIAHNRAIDAELAERAIPKPSRIVRPQGAVVPLRKRSTAA